MGNVLKKSEGRRGNAVLEFALGSTLLFLLLGGVSDFARLFFYSEMVVGASQAGVQYGSQGLVQAQDIAGMQNAAKAEPGTLTGLTATATNYCQCPGTTGNVGCGSTCTGGVTPSMFINVTTNYTFSTVVNWPLIPNSVPIASSTTYQVR